LQLLIPMRPTQKTVTWLESVDVKVVTTIEVIKSTYSRLFSNLKIGQLTSENVYAKTKHQVKLLSVPFSSGCTSLRTIEIVELLENDLGLPVVTSNQASLWDGVKNAEPSMFIERLRKATKASNSHKRRAYR